MEEDEKDLEGRWREGMSGEERKEFVLGRLEVSSELDSEAPWGAKR